MEASRLAYAFYATDDQYAVAAIIVARQLKRLNHRNGIDFVVLHLHVSEPLLILMNTMGIITRRVRPLPPVYNDYYRHCLVKLRILQLEHYRRVVFVESDTIVLKSLDDLFDLKLDEGIAAPPAYWLPHPYVTSLLLVVKPSRLFWARVNRHFRDALVRQYYDMDIINDEFQGEIKSLPPEDACLNSEWEDQHGPFYFGNPNDSINRVRVVHFTALGKPWHYHPDEVRRLRPEAHPIFYDLWEQWWSERWELLDEAPLSTKLLMTRLIHQGRRQSLA